MTSEVCISPKSSCSIDKQNNRAKTLNKNNIHQSIIDSIENPVLFINTDFNIEYVNPITEDFLSTSIHEIVGINIRNFVAQGRLSPICIVIINSIASKIDSLFESRSSIKWIKSFPNKETLSNVYFHIVATPVLENSTHLGFTISISNVSQEVISKDNLRHSMSLTKNIFNHSRDAIFTLDSSLSLICMNLSAHKLFVNSQCNYIGKKIEDIICINTPLSSQKLIPEALAKQKLNQRLQIYVFDKSGKEHYFEISVGTVKASNSMFFTAIFHDVSILKNGESQLHLELHQANKQNEAKSTFLAVMSHEIKTPLIGILGVHEILQDTNLNEEQSRYLEIATASSRTLLSIINGVLDFSKIEAGKLELEMLSFNPEDTVNQVVEILASTAFKKGISLQTYIDPNLPTAIVSDPVRLHQVLMNLINNAIKFTENGGISVSVLKSSQDPNQLVFEVNDTGIGIPSNKLKTIFDDFTQVENSTQRRYGGTGLGLAISNRLVTLLGGELKLSSELGVGSTFCFTLLSAEPITSDVYKAPSGLKGVKLLLVDNSMISSSMLTRQLQSFSLEVSQVNTLNQALHSFVSPENDDDPYQIVIVNLFKLDGNLSGFCKSLEVLSDIDKCCFILIGPSESIRETKSYHETIFTSAIPLPIRRATLVQRIKLLLEKGVDDYKPNQRTGMALPLLQKNTCVLIVDDSSTSRIVTESMLNRAGYSTLKAANGEEAISTLSQNKIDLVLMDMSMPVMDGIEATIYIRTLPKFKTLPIIAMTATALQEEIDACLHAGMDDYLGKPFTKQVLLNKLAEWENAAEAESVINQTLAISANPKTIETPDNSTLVDNSAYIDSEILFQILEDLPTNKHSEIINLFVSELALLKEKINPLLEKKDILALGDLAHKLKGSVTSFGATLLIPLATNLEQCCKQNKAEEAEELAKQVIGASIGTLEAYRNLVAGL